MSRLDRLRAALRANSLDALVVVPGSNLFYLTGLRFTTKLRLTAAIIPADGEPSLVLPALELDRAKRELREAMPILTWGDAEGPTAALHKASAAANLAGKRIGIENTVMRVFELRGLEQAATGAEIIDATNLIAAMRMVKQPDELAAMREAVRLIEETLHHTVERMHAGITELEVEAIWARAIQAAGVQPSFGLAVGSGPNGANPHHTNGERQLQAGDLVVLDGGVYVDGYASDITRTIAVGAISEEARRIYDLVQAANAAGRAACVPGASGHSVDHAARLVIEQGGYGPAFIHRTGHGLGLDIHEPPFIVGGNHEPLPIGSTFTVEPGIYLTGKLGVRIEDDMVITADGAESLTSFERGLVTC
jgi:Xaa-Pro aminopeptidase